MPFNNATGTYTPPAAAEDAFPGKIIASADWNAIFTDLSAALTTLGQQSWVTNAARVINITGNIIVATSDSVILVQANVPQITLPLGNTKPYPVKIIGAAAGIFGTHNCSVVPTSPDTISGQASAPLTADYQIATFYPLPTGGYVVAYG